MNFTGGSGAVFTDVSHKKLSSYAFLSVCSAAVTLSIIAFFYSKIIVTSQT